MRAEEPVQRAKENWSAEIAVTQPSFRRTKRKVGDGKSTGVAKHVSALAGNFLVARVRLTNIPAVHYTLFERNIARITLVCFRCGRIRLALSFFFRRPKYLFSNYVFIVILLPD